LLCSVLGIFTLVLDSQSLVLGLSSSASLTDAARLKRQRLGKEERKAEAARIQSKNYHKDFETGRGVMNGDNLLDMVLSSA
jgi:hypothetical protein